MASVSKTKKLFLDDLAVGDEFTSEEFTVDAPQIREFAQQFDPQPFHRDEAAARQRSVAKLLVFRRKRIASES